MPSPKGQAAHSTPVTTLFQLIALIIVTALLALLFLPPFYSFRPKDQVPVIKPYTTPLPEQKQVHLGIHIDNFVEFDIVRNNFVVEGSLWFAYDPKNISRKDIDQFTFDQATLERSEPIILKENGLEVAHYTFRATLKMQFNYENYPLDDHRLYLMIKNDALTTQQAQFVMVPGNLTVSQQAQGRSSHVFEHPRASVGYSSYHVNVTGEDQLFSYNRALCTFDCNRVDMRHFLNIFLPLFLIFFLTLFSFSFVYNQHLTDVPSIAAASIPALFAYRFVIESLSPNVSYFMVSDYLFFLYLLLSLLTFLSVSRALNEPVRIKKLIIIGLYALMLVGCAAIIWTL